MKQNTRHARNAHFAHLLRIAIATTSLAICATLAAFDGPASPHHPSSAQPLTYFPIDQRPEFSLSLNGTWKFQLATAPADFAQPGFNDNSWKPIRVPGHWELQGFEPPKYTNPNPQDGFYRRTFTAPASWTGRRTFIRFDGVLFAFEFFVDGKRAGCFASGFNRSEFDITDFITPGKPTVLAVRVMRREKGWEFDTVDDWGISGIHRDVTLFSMPETHVKDYTIVTPVTVTAGVAKASVRITTWVDGFAKKSTKATFTAKLTDAHGNVAGTLTKNVTLPAPGASDAPIVGEIPVTNPQLWTAETPNLYRLDCLLVVDGKPVHQFTQRVGLRTTSIEGNVFKLNDVPVKLRGICHLEIHPGTGRAMTREQYIEDILLMKAANLNAVRTSTFPPQKIFLELCDEYGMYVSEDVPFAFGKQHLTDDSYEDNLALRARATVARDKNQTSVILWTIGNENPYTPMVVRTAGIVKALDPSRSRCLAHPSGKYYFELPPELDVMAPHYILPRSIRKHTRRTAPIAIEDILDHPELAGPVVIAEYSHAAGNSMEMLRESWDIIQKNDRFFGGFIWHFHDQGLYRTVPAGAYPGIPKENDHGPVKIDDVLATTWVTLDRVIDTGGQAGADGIMDADRVPQSDYWAVQKILSPIVIPIESLPIKTGGQTLRIPIENRYDFTNLSAAKGKWELRIDGQVAQSGNLALTAPPRTETAADIAINIPANPAARDYFLRFIFTDSKGRDITMHTVRLAPEGAPLGSANIYKPQTGRAPAGRIDISEKGAIVTYTAGGNVLQVDKETGAVAFGAAGKPTLAFRNLALRVGREPQMSEIRAYREIGSAYWMPCLLVNHTLNSVTTGAPDGTQAKITLQLQFDRQPDAGTSRTNVAGQGFLADITLTLSARGWLDIDYTLTPVNARDHLLSLGLALRLPKNSTRLTWLGKGPYAVYPLQAEGMERGVWTVAPREDFNTANRMYGGERVEVDLASATDANGNGLGVVCQNATVSLEPEGDSAYFTQVLLASGRGEKRNISRANIDTKTLKPVTGTLRLLPLSAGKWPAIFQSVLGTPEISPRIVESMPKE